jgi:hypothetical protein
MEKVQEVALIVVVGGGGVSTEGMVAMVITQTIMEDFIIMVAVAEGLSAQVAGEVVLIIHPE